MSADPAVYLALAEADREQETAEAVFDKARSRVVRLMTLAAEDADFDKSDLDRAVENFERTRKTARAAAARVKSLLRALGV